MADALDLGRWQESLVEAFHNGDEARARALASQLRAQPRKARALLEAMLTAPEARVRQAAAFALGELGGAASARRLEQQLVVEESRGDYDGASVVEAITQALGHVEDAGARASLLRRLQRLVASASPEPSEVDEVARSLWLRRHPELIPVIRQALERLAPSASRSLHGLLALLEKSPDALGAWARESSVPLEHRTSALILLGEEVPEPLLPTLAVFISTAHALVDTAATQKGPASNYCDRLFTLLLLHREHLLPALAPEARTQLGAVARRLVAAVSLNCALGAAVVLGLVGRPEDAALLEAHRPAEPIIAKVFDDAARQLRDPPRA